MIEKQIIINTVTFLLMFSYGSRRRSRRENEIKATTQLTQTDERTDTPINILLLHFVKILPPLL